MKWLYIACLKSRRVEVAKVMPSSDDLIKGEQ